MMRILGCVELLVVAIIQVLMVAVIEAAQPKLANQLSLAPILNTGRVIPDVAIVGLAALPVLPAIDYALGPGISMQTRVLTVENGDTIRVEGNDARWTVRCLGVQTPAINNHFWSGAHLGELAWALNRQMVENASILLESDVSDTDRPGNLVGYVWVGDEMDNAELLQQGPATVRIMQPDVR